ncbi:hypothetical protein [Weissella cibaria]|uniref:hypothetical protein n=1 Tax=Weissella cibaria TaxID=137591 RepID=UPI000706D2E0|nr:hypothetical protein [Weissella cibaria]ALI33141.1 hypothetical protein AO080_06625 [Weissella cibaria]
MKVAEFVNLQQVLSYNGIHDVEARALPTGGVQLGIHVKRHIEWALTRDEVFDILDAMEGGE